MIENAGGKGFAKLLKANSVSSIANYQSHVLHFEALPWQESKSFSGNLTRKSCWFTCEGCSCPYQYGKGKRNIYVSEVMPAWMGILANQLEALLNLEKGYFNSCNANAYLAREHDLPWHCDDEYLFREADAPTSKRNVLIASISFGATRDFAIRQKLSGSEMSYPLADGDILTMEGLFQDNYLHCVRKDTGSAQASSSSSGPDTTRYNLTFRRILRHHKECSGEL